MEDQPFAARRDALGDARQHFVGIDPQALRRFALGRRELVAHPAEDDAAVVHRSADHPVAIGQRIAERAAFGIRHRLVDHRAHRSAGADGDGHLARLDRVDAEVRQHAVVRADDERRCRVDAQLGRHAAVQALDVIGRRHERRKLLALTPANVERPVVPVERREVEQAGGRGNRMVDQQRPNRRKNTYSLMPTKRAAAANSFGCSWRSHASLASGDIGWIGVPVRR